MKFCHKHRGRTTVLPFCFLRKQSAFTLIELIIVISVIGIIGVVVSLSGRSQDGMNLDAFSQQLLQDIRYVQTLAISRHQTVQIQFNSGGYTLTDMNANTVPNAYDSNHFIIPSDMIITLSNASDNSAISNNRFSYNSDGEPLLNNAPMINAIYITLTTNTQNKKLILSPQTGKVDEVL